MDSIQSFICMLFYNYWKLRRAWWKLVTIATKHKVLMVNLYKCIILVLCFNFSYWDRGYSCSQHLRKSLLNNNNNNRYFHVFGNFWEYCPYCRKTCFKNKEIVLKWLLICYCLYKSSIYLTNLNKGVYLKSW